MRASPVLEHVREAELIEWTRRLHRFPSFSGEEGEVAADLAQQLRSLGLEAELQEVELGRPNVIGRLRGTGDGPSFMFNGHLDIDPIPMGYPGDPWEFRREGGKLFGHGIRNMKAGVAAMVAAAGALARAGVPLRGDLIVAGVIGELQGGLGTVHHLQAGVVPDYAIVPEPTLLNIRTLHAGISQFLISTRGKACWAGSVHLYPHVNAVEKMCKVIEALRGLSFSAAPHPEIPHLPRRHIGNLIGGLTRDYVLWRPSYVPDYCTVVFEARTVPGQTVEDVLADLRRVLDPLREEDPDLVIEIEPPPAAYRPPWRGMIGMPPLDLPKDDPLVEIVRRCHVAVLGAEPERIGFVDPGSYAGADSGHLQRAGAHVLNYGPTGHSFWEHAVEVKKLVSCARVLALAAEEVLASPFDRLPGNTLRHGSPPERRKPS